MQKVTAPSDVSAISIEKRTLLARGQREILDRELAARYGVTTGSLNQTGSRNIGRFPPDFVFQLARDELSNLEKKHDTDSRSFQTLPPIDAEARIRAGEAAPTNRLPRPRVA
jgi:hypothetical protein